VTVIEKEVIGLEGEITGTVNCREDEAVRR